MSGAIPDKGVREFILTNVTNDADGKLYWRVNIDAVSANLEKVFDAHLDGVYKGEALFVHGGASNYLLPSDHDTVRSGQTCDV